jgi:hypothetical protein
MKAPVPGVPTAQQDPTVLLALTILGEAENQPYAGKVAVGKTVVTRAHVHQRTVADIVLTPWQYDCWEKRAAPQRVAFLEQVIAQAAENVQPPGLWEECLQAAESALDPGIDDPTNGATHYCTLTDGHGHALWDCDDSHLRHPRWHSKQCIESGITKELWRLGAHVFALTR